MLTGDARDEPSIVFDYQTSIDHLCQVISNPEITINALDIFFRVHPKLDNVDGRDSKSKLKPIQVAALKGNFTAFRYLYEEKNASLAIESLPNKSGDYILEENIIEYVSQEEINEDIRKYIWDNKLWRKFNDRNLLEVYALGWCGQIEKTMEALTFSNLSDKEIERFHCYIAVFRDLTDKDAPIIQHLAKIRTTRKRHFEEQETNLNAFVNESDDDGGEFSDDEDDEPEIDILSQQQKVTDVFCNIAGDDDKNSIDLADYLATLTEGNFNIDARHSESKARAVDCAAEKGSLDSFKYIVEVLNADITYDPNEPIANLMGLITRADVDRTNYFFRNRLWEKQNDGTTELHAYAWLGDCDKVTELVFQNQDCIFDINADGESVLDVAHASKNTSVLEFLFRAIDKMIEYAGDRHFSDMLRDLYVLRAKHFSLTNCPQESIDDYYQALHFHRHATIDYSRETEDKLLRGLSIEFNQYRHDLLKNIPLSLCTVNILNTLESTQISCRAIKYSLETFTATYKKALAHQKEAMRISYILTTKSPSDLTDFTNFRLEVIKIYNDLAMLYGSIGRLLHNSKYYYEGVKAFECSKQALDEAIALGSNTKNQNYYFYYGPDSPMLDAVTVSTLYATLNSYIKDRDVCARKAVAAVQSSSSTSNTSSSSSSSKGFTIFKPLELLPEPPVKTSSSKPCNLVIRY